MLRNAILFLATLFLVLVCFPVTYFSNYVYDDYEPVFVEANLPLGDSVEPVRFFSGQQEDFLLIKAWLAETWIYQPFQPPVDDLDANLSRHGSSISVFFQNLDTGFIYTYNPDAVYFGASLNKINHALYTFVLAERGYISMETVHTFTEGDRRGGTGQIQHMEEGTRFTTRELLRHSMIHSCNVAARMLIRYTNRAEFTYHQFVEEVGANPDYIGNIATQNTDLFDKAIWMNAVHDYIWSDGTYSHFFRQDLLATPGFIRADYPMARKYGWATGAFHDAAIVYAPSPYILILMSTRSDGGGAPGLFRDISYMFQEFNRMWFD